jgi:hypothetical protein
MNLYVTLLSLPLAAAMIWAAISALIRAERIGRCGRPFVVPIFAGMASLVLFGLHVIDQQQVTRTPRDVYFGMQLIQSMLIIAVILLLVPHLQRRGR